MTLPDERYRAVMQTREFLIDLTDYKKYPKVPKLVRQHAIWCLRHYPSGWDMEAASRGVPEVFAKQMDPLHRIIVQYEQEKETNK
jgi:hypothetical protein